MSAVREASDPAGGVAALAAREARAADQPALRPDLVIRKLVQLGEVNWAVRSPETNKIHMFDEATWELVMLYDGTRTRAGIRDDYNRRFPEGEGIPLQHVLDLEESLRGLKLLVVSSRGRSLDLLQSFQTARRRTADKNAEGVNPMYMMFHAVDPDRFLEATQKYVRWLWTPPAVAFSCLLFALTLGVYVQHWDTIWRQTLETYAFYQKPFLQVLQFFAVFVSIGVFHELSHAYVTKFYGGEVHSVGFALFYFAPSMYCDCTDSILFESKWQRLWVSLAGIYVEAWMTVLATALWLATYPDTGLHDFAYKAMLYAGVSTVFFNINPLIKIDGYYALTDLLGIPTLREDAFGYLGAFIQRRLLRLPVPLDPLPRRRRRFLGVYAILAALWAGLIMWFIGHLLFNFYGKVLPDFALLLTVATLIQFFRKRVNAVWRVVKLFYLDKKELLMSKRMRVPLLAAAAAVVLAMAIPWSHRSIRSEILLQPGRTLKLQAPEDGVVTSVNVHEGVIVREGDVVLVLSSLPVDTRIAALSAESERLSGHAGRMRVSGDARGTFRDQAGKAALDVELAGERAQRDRLAVRSPAAGTVLTQRLEDLEGRFVRAGTFLADIGDCRTLTAAIPVTERLLTDLAPGQPVSVQLRGRPFPILRGRITSIAPAAEAAAEPASPGDALRPTERPGRFVAIATFDNSDGSLLPSSSGTARIDTARASLLSRGGRILYRWVRTIVW
ncbi:MAG: HlyD family efflux transporter periplasmic adaptor subunit [Thermoanaerobaculia bacterium]